MAEQDEHTGLCEFSFFNVYSIELYGITIAVNYLFPETDLAFKKVFRAI